MGHNTSIDFVIFFIIIYFFFPLLSDFEYVLLPDKLHIKEGVISWGTRITGTWILVLRNAAKSCQPPVVSRIGVIACQNKLWGRAFFFFF